MKLMEVRSSATGDVGSATDAELLRRFIADRDEAAMTAIVERHGPLVMGLCRSILRNEQDAADSFQSTFLVLLKNAASIGKPASLSSWLHGVACRVAMRARSQAALRRKRENEVAAMAPETHSHHDASSDPETSRLIHEELLRLPEQLRLPLILCSLQGRSREEAAQQLGWTPGSVKGRLERGREMLHARLTKRGVALPSAAIGVLLAQQGATAVPASLASSTVKALVLAAAGKSILGGVVSVNAAALTKGVLVSMKVAKLKTTALVALGLLFVGGSTAVIVPTVRRMIAESRPLPPVSATGNVQLVLESPGGGVVSVAPAYPGGFVYRTAIEPFDQARENLKQLGLAMHNHHDAKGTFPFPATRNAAGAPLLSWRVALLPYLNEAELYSQFKHDEPWDSPHNLALVVRMPKVFYSASSNIEEPGQTFFQVFVGPGTVFHEGATRSISQISDGTSSTLLIVESATAVPWTKPEDMTYDPNQPLPALGGVRPDVFMGLLADGSTRAFSRETAETTLRAMITAAGGEPVNP